METTALAPGSAEAPALNQTPSETAALVAETTDFSSGEGTLPGDDLNDRIEAFLNTPETPPAEKPQEAPAPEEPAKEAREPEAIDETPAADPETEVPPAKNWRIKPKTDDDAKVLEMYRRNPDLTLAEAAARVRGRAEPQQPAAKETQSSQQPEANPVLTVEALEKRKAELKTQIKKASAEDFDFEKAAELQLELAELPFQMLEARQREQFAKSEQETAHKSAVTTAEQKAVELYPDINVEGSEIRERMDAIAVALAEAGDPLLDRPECGLRIAQMAAAELGIAPATAKRQEKSPPVSEKAPEPVRTAPPVKPRPIPGSGAAPQTAPQIDLKKLSMEQLEELAAKV